MHVPNTGRIFFDDSSERLPLNTFMIMETIPSFAASEVPYQIKSLFSFVSTGSKLSPLPLGTVLDMLVVVEEDMIDHRMNKQYKCEIKKNETILLVKVEKQMPSSSK